MVGEARQVLSADVAGQLQGVYGLQPDGTALDIQDLAHLPPEGRDLAAELREWQSHLAAADPGQTERGRREAAFRRMTHEAAFTTLNRLAALRMAEERDLIIESVRKGPASDGFRLFERLAGASLGDRDDAYATYLGLQFDELAVELGVLFERRTPVGRLFPRPAALSTVLDLLDAPRITPLWAADETIGWIYQYFNSKAERDAMRKASAAPRNSREMAVRNQFFTPRPVVEFLVDNTLGRLWYEMRSGDTRLTVECPNLIRRSTEAISSQTGSSSRVGPVQDGPKPADPPETAPLPPLRQKKDPRDLRILDPAVGSGHFLLRAYDVLETIYEEAWADPEPVAFEGRSLSHDYTTLDDLRRALPALILRHNLHGIDIDPRASQIAALALWLRVQRAYKELSLAASERPAILRSNIVTAEPMPGRTNRVDDFSASLRPRVLGDLVRVVWEKMQLAGEAGSLLRIDAELASAISAARSQWQRQPEAEQLAIFENSQPRPEQLPLFDVSGISDSRFWEQAEGRVIAALSDYTERATAETATARRLFADDALEGFAFIELCRKSYDVVLMNPPFGLAPRPVYEYLTTAYPTAYSDLAIAFMERGLALAPGGLTGAITSRAFLTVADAQAFRRDTAIRKIELLVDLGTGVMDGALVDASAQVLSNTQASTCLIGDLRKRDNLEELLEWARAWEESPRSRIVSLNCFLGAAGARIAYDQASDAATLLAAEGQGLDPVDAIARTGGSTFEDERFLRLRWEPSSESVGLDATWAPLGRNVPEFSPYYYPSEVVIKWNRDGRELQARNEIVNGQTAQARQGSSHYGRPGLIFGRRSSPTIAARIHPAGCSISSTSGLIMAHDPDESMALLAYLNSSPVRAMLATLTTRQSYTVGHIRALAPMPAPISRGLRDRAELIVGAKRLAYSRLETDPFAVPWPPVGQVTLREVAQSEVDRNAGARAQVERLAAEIDSIVEATFGISPSSGETRGAASPRDISRGSVFSDPTPSQVARRLLSFAVGAAFGRWDVRRAVDGGTGSRTPGPFEALPRVAPGGLATVDGLPCDGPEGISPPHQAGATSSGVDNGASPSAATRYPIRIAWPGIIVEDAGLDDIPGADDLVVRIREVIAVLWPSEDGSAAEAIEAEACEHLGVRSLRDYLRRPNGFFADHLSAYSKSRRQAPIYWPISTPSGAYTLWIYYPRLSDDLLYRAVTDYLDPKLSEVDRRLTDTIEQLAPPITRDAAKLRRQLDELRTVQADLKDMRGELLRVASLPYRPSPDDGVLISAAPLHELFRLPGWRADLAACWENLAIGKHDWSHLAYAIWPERVKEVCRGDKSIAIAHGLDTLYEGTLLKPGRSRANQKLDPEDDSE